MCPLFYRLYTSKQCKVLGGIFTAQYLVKNNAMQRIIGHNAIDRFLYLQAIFIINKTGISVNALHPGKLAAVLPANHASSDLTGYRQRSAVPSATRLWEQKSSTEQVCRAQCGDGGIRTHVPFDRQTDFEFSTHYGQ